MTDRMATEFIEALEAMYSRRYLPASVEMIKKEIAGEPDKSATKALLFLDRMAESNSDEARNYKSLLHPKAVVRLIREQSIQIRENEAEKMAEINRKKDSDIAQAMRNTEIGRAVNRAMDELDGTDETFIALATRLHNQFPQAGFDYVAENRRREMAA